MIPCSRVLQENAVISQLVKNSLHFMEPDGSLPCSQQHVTCSCPEADQSNLVPHSISAKIHFNIVLSRTSRSCQMACFLQISLPTLCIRFSSPPHLPRFPSISPPLICSPPYPMRCKVHEAPRYVVFSTPS